MTKERLLELARLPGDIEWSPTKLLHEAHEMAKTIIAYETLADKARAREDALLRALKLTVKHMENLHCEDAYGGCSCSLESCDCVLAGDYAAVTDCIRDIEASQ